MSRTSSWVSCCPIKSLRVGIVLVMLAILVRMCVPAMAAEVVQVHAGVHPTLVKQGRKAQLLVELQIAQGCHINSHKPDDHSVIPTILTVDSPVGVTAGQPVYPSDNYVTTEFSPVPLKVYDGAVEIRVPLEVGSRVGEGQINVSASLRFQACNNRMCFPPQTVHLSTEFTVTHSREGH
jgi:thiol:disulfide interchange protein DsbD